jgi:hypothetical protein
METKYLFTFMTLSLANYIYQLFKDQDWDRALEISFFQGIACLVCSFLKM